MIAAGAPTAAAVDALLDGWLPPPDLALGVATAGYQCEGGFNGPGQPRNNWQGFEGTGGRDATGACARFWDRPAVDLDLAAGIGLSAFRLSLEPARLWPEPPGGSGLAIDRAAVDGYARILRAAQERGLQPIVTLQHFTHPAWWGADPWLAGPGIELYLEHAARACEEVTTAVVNLGGAPIGRWITINEPNILALVTYTLGLFPSRHRPGPGAPGRLVEALDGLYAAHVRAYAAIHAVHARRGWPRPQVTVNSCFLDSWGLDRIFLDLLAGGLPRGPAELDRALAPRRAAFEQRMLQLRRGARHRNAARALAAVLRPFFDRLVTPARLPRLVAALRAAKERPLDLLAVDLYDPLLENHLRSAFTGGQSDPWNWNVHPPAFGHALKTLRQAAPLPLLVAENGMAVRRELGARAAVPRADGWTRDAFLRAHLFQLLRALRAGLPIDGWLCWSIADNYEWGRFSPRFGLYHVDFDAPERPRGPGDAEGVDAAGALREIQRAWRAQDGQALRASLLQASR